MLVATDLGDTVELFLTFRKESYQLEQFEIL